MNKRFKGFTLAEVLITLSIIGVVAALTIPILVKNLNSYAFSKAQTITLAKITEATNQMKSNDDLDGYTTTEAFADAFQKYMKISKRCTAANLNECFPPKIKKTNGTELDVSTLNTGVKLGQSTYTSPTVALALANGTTIILGINPSCTRIEPTDNTTSTTSCIAMLYDINGFAGPNQLGKDVKTLNAEVDFMIVDGISVALGDIDYPYINTCDGGTAEDKAWDPTGSSNDWCLQNGYASSKKYCAALGLQVPTKDQLNTMYINRAAIGGFTGEHYWSSTEANVSQGWAQYFTDGSQDVWDKDWRADDGNFHLRCVK